MQNKTDLHLKLQGGELETILDALKLAAEKYSKDRIPALTSGNNELYLVCQKKKSMCWQAYAHIRRAAGLDNFWEEEDYERGEISREQYI